MSIVENITALKSSQALPWVISLIERGNPLRIYRQGSVMHVRDVMVNQNYSADLCIAGVTSSNAATIAGAVAYLSGLTGTESYVSAAVCGPDPAAPALVVATTSDPQCILIWLRGLWEDMHPTGETA